MSDLFDRQAVNDVFVKLQQDCFANGHLDEWYFLVQVAKEVNEIPSTEPEPLTDAEQRIFLAAMERERKVCRQVDEECRTTREPYEDSLVHVCNEIERKVKGALWT